MKYWTNDGGGLYYLSADGTTPIADLNQDIADSDYKFTCTAPQGYMYKGCAPGWTIRINGAPRNGYYIAVIKKYNDIEIPTPASSLQFGILAAPETYNHTGNHIFVVNTKGEKFKSEGAGKSAEDIFDTDYASWTNISTPTMGNNTVGQPWIGTDK